MKCFNDVIGPVIGPLLGSFDNFIDFWIHDVTESLDLRIQY